MSEDVHEVFAIRYAHHARRSAENFIGGDPHDVLQPLDYFVWAIKGPSGAIVVDTGFDEPMARRRQREITKPLREGLDAVGIAPESVKTVIVSHLHYDHCGNYDLFPHARYHLQDREMAYATGRCMCHAMLRMPFEADDVVAMVRKVFAGRVTFHDGEDEISPGVTIHHIGGHAKGLQSVRVRPIAATRTRRRCRAPLCAPRTRPSFSDHLQRRRGPRRLRNPEEARHNTQPHCPGTRPAGAQTLRGSETRARELGCTTGYRAGQSVTIRPAGANGNHAILSRRFRRLLNGKARQRKSNR